MIFKKQLQPDKELYQEGFMDLLESMFLIGIILDFEGKIKYVNPYFLRVTGYTATEVTGKNWFDVFIPIKKIDTVKKTFDIITRENYKMRSENPILAKDGSEIVIEWHNAPLRDKNGTCVGTVSIGVDITGRIEIEKMLTVTEEASRTKAKQLEEKNAILEETKKGMLNLLDDSRRLEEELQKEKKSVEQKVVERTTELNREKARMEAAINSVPSGFMVTDKKGNGIIINAALNQILTLPNREQVTVSAVADVLSGQEISEKYQYCLEMKSPVHIEELNYGKKILNVYMAPIFISQISSEIIGAILLINDVTEEKALARSKDEFFSIASHELRTPITAIRGNLELMTKFYSKQIADPSFTEMLEDMKESSVRLIHLVNEFLNTSRLEQGKIIFNTSEFVISSVIEMVINELSVSVDEKGLKLKYKKREALPKVKADPEKVKEVLVNLIGNAIAYTDKGSIEVSAVNEGDFVKVSVKDTGKGIPEANQHLLFRKFQQANTNLYARDISNSTGLGLYISKLLVENMGGTIALESSKENFGSTFCFTLPVA